MADNMLGALEGQLESLGKSLEGTIEEWQTAEAEKRTELESKIKGLEEGIGELRETIKEEKRFHLPGVEAAESSEQKEAFSVARACRAIATKNFDHAPYEREVFENMHAKAMSQGTDSAGGFVVPEEAIRPIIEKLKAQVTVFERGATEMQCTGVPCVVPRISTSATAYWVSENSAITASDLAFEQISMSPKTVAGRVILSNLLLETSRPTADQVIEQDLASQLGLAVDLAVLAGTGSSGQPTGIMTDANISNKDTALTNVAPPTIEELLGFIDALMADNALRGSLGWILHPTALTQIRLVETGDTTAGHVPTQRFDLAGGPSQSILGYPYSVSTQMTAPTGTVDTNSMLFGNFSDVMVARWGGMRLLASNTSDDAFSKDQTHIRATMRMDVGLRHPESFCRSGA